MPYLYFPQIIQQVSWGQIVGEISSQSDLQSSFSAKSHEHNEYFSKQFSQAVFSKYGAIEEASYILPNAVSVPTGCVARLFSAIYLLNSGTVQATLKLNGTAISEFSDIGISASKNTRLAVQDIQLLNGDLLTLTIENAQLATDLYFYVIIQIDKADEI